MISAYHLDSLDIPAHLRLQRRTSPLPHLKLDKNQVQQCFEKSGELSFHTELDSIRFIPPCFPQHAKVAYLPAPYVIWCRVQKIGKISHPEFASSPNPFPRAVGGPAGQRVPGEPASADLLGAAGCTCPGRPGLSTSSARVNCSAISRFSQDKRSFLVLTQMPW